MGASLVHRYKGASQEKEAANAIARLNSRLRGQAEIVGRAARLGAMLSGSIIGTLAHCPLTRDGEVLRLTFTNGARAFAGERVERRLMALAAAMNLKGEMVV